MAAPLDGKRVLVTRAAHQAGKLSDGLRALGAEPVEVPVLEIRPPLDCDPMDAALEQLDAYDWLIFTSANTVRALVERSAALGIAFDAAGIVSREHALKEHDQGPAEKPQALKGHDFSRAENESRKEGASASETRFPQIAAIGDATAKAARDAGFVVALVPENYVAESLVEAFLHHARNVSGHDFNRAEDARALKGHGFSRAEKAPQQTGALAPEGSLRVQRILLARAEIARDVIPDALRAAGASVDVVDAYRNVVPEAAPELLRAALEEGIDAATFTSSSSVTHLAEAARAAGIPFPFEGVPAASIGPITSATLREAGWEPAAEASPSDIPGLIDAIARLFEA